MHVRLVFSRRAGLLCGSLCFLAGLSAAQARLANPLESMTAAQAAEFFHGSRVYGDEDILVAVHRQLATDPRVSSYVVEVSVLDGEVRLEGEARSLLMKDAAVELAEGVRGVRRVVDGLTVRPAPRAADELAADLRQRLDGLAVARALEVDLQVQGTLVTLRGSAATWAQRQAVEDAVRAVAGVAEVHNQVVVVPGPARPDPAIRADVRRRLDADGWVNATLVRVEVRSGSVVLGGSVESARERSRAIRLAWVDSVRAVDAQALTVDWSWNAAWHRRVKDVRSPDADVAARLLQALEEDPRVAFSGRVEVRVRGGRAQLGGTLDSWAARAVAQDVAANTPGVWGVDVAILVRPGEPAPDDVLAAQVRRALAADPVLGSRGLAVQAQDGRVELRGSVDNEFSRRWAEQVAGSVRGVAQLDNALALTETWSSDADSRVRSNVESALAWSPYWSGSAVAVRVRYGGVTLDGNVLDWREWRVALRQAEHAGAKQVVDNLAVLAPAPADVAAAPPERETAARGSY